GRARMPGPGYDVRVRWTSRSWRGQANRPAPSWPGRSVGTGLAAVTNPSCTVTRMPPLMWDSRPDGLRAPALVCAFKGWNDAGDAASAAVQFVGASHNATRFAQIDPEDFYDFQATRPRIKLTEGRTRELAWPSVEIYEARIPRAPRDLVLLAGPEPSFRWRSFCHPIVDLAEALGVQLVVTCGALLADVPHSRPVAITGLASDEALTERLGLQNSNYEGPTGITGVLHAACAEAGLPSASL